MCKLSAKPVKHNRRGCRLCLHICPCGHWSHGLSYGCKTNPCTSKFSTPLSRLSVRTANAQIIHHAAVCTARPRPAFPHDVIIGWDFLSRHDAVIHCAPVEIQLSPFSCLTPGSEPSASNKLLVREDTRVPPNSSTVVSGYCIALADTFAHLSPSDRVGTRKGFLVAFATANFSQGSAAIYVTNHPLHSSADAR